MMNTRRLEELTDAWRDGCLTAADAAELSATLRESEDARRIFRDEAQMHGLLHRAVMAAAVVEASSHLSAPREGVRAGARPRFLRLSWGSLAAAAALIVLCGIAVIQWMGRGVEIEVVQRSSGASVEWKAGDKVRAKELTMVRGTMRLRLASGVVMDVTAPVEMKLLDAMHVRVLSGRVTADVGEHGKGFVIETPEARVVDLGTVFGVDASSAAKTDVVVFKGQVEVFEKGAKERVALLNQGEGLRVERNRRASRIVSVTGSDESGSWSAQERPPENAIISAVRDSMSADDEQAKKWPSLRNFYRIVPGGLRDGALAFSDEADEWSGVPPNLVGADQVRTFAVDSHNWFMKLTVTASRPAELFVFVDQRNPVPDWVRADFTETGETITLDFKPVQAGGRVAQRLPYSIWRRVVDKPGEVTLGAPYANPPADKKSFHPNRMFGVAAKALP